MVYNLLYYQVVAQVSCGLSRGERAKACELSISTHIDSLSAALVLINEVLGQTELYIDDEGTSSSHVPQFNILALEQQVNQLFLNARRKLYNYYFRFKNYVYHF